MPKRHTLSRLKSLAGDIKNRLERHKGEGKGIGFLTVVEIIVLLVQLMRLLDQLEKEIEE